jgi:hypothetical protein
LPVVMMVLHARSLLSELRTVGRKALSHWRTHRPVMMMVLHSRSRLRPLIRRLARLARLRPTLREPLLHLLSALHVLRKPLLKLLALLPLRLWSAITSRRAIAALRRLRPALRPALLKVRPAIAIATPIATRSVHSKFSVRLRPPLAISVAAWLTLVGQNCSAGIRSAGLRIAALRTAHESSATLRVKFVRRDPPIAAAIQLLQRLRRILHFLRIDHAIMIRIEQTEKPRPTPALSIRALLSIGTRPVRSPAFRPLPIGALRSIAPLFAIRSTLAIPPLLAIRPALLTGPRQSLRCIRRLRRRIRRRRGRLLRAEDRGRQRDRGKEKRLEVHMARACGVAPQAAAVGSLHKTPLATFVV